MKIDDSERVTSPESEKKCTHCCLHTTLNSARKLMESHNWELASKAYVTALDSAEQKLHKQNEKKSAHANQYVRTAVELIYCLRKLKHPTNFGALIEIIKFNLFNAQVNIPLAPLIKPLEDISYCHDARLSLWMATLFAIDERRKSVIH